MRHFHENRCGSRHHDRSDWRAMRRGDHDPFDRGGFGPRGFVRGGLRGGPPGGPGRRRRMFEAGELRPVLLLLMEGEARHGYDLIRAIEERTGGAYAPSPGIIYPTLTLLEDLGQVAAAAAEGTKRLFAITDAGRAELDANRQEAEGALARLDALKAERAPFDGGPVRRAMHNLGAAVMQRLGASPDKATLFAVTDLIDEAGRRIERL